MQALSSSAFNTCFERKKFSALISTHDNATSVFCREVLAAAWKHQLAIAALSAESASPRIYEADLTDTFGEGEFISALSWIGLSASHPHVR